MKPIHTDIFNTNINVGDYVISYLRNTLKVFIVEKLSPKMVRLKLANSNYTVHRYPAEIMIIDKNIAVFKILQESK